MDIKKSNLSNEQKEILKQFRSKLKDVLTPHHTDAILLKFLRANAFNLKKAELNFREVQWNRISYNIDNILDSFILPEVFKYRGDTFLGFAKDGSAIRYVTLRVEFYSFLLSLSTYEVALFFVHLMEGDLKALREENKRTGKEVNEVTYIIDADGTSVWHFTHKLLIEIGMDLIRLLQEHYPEIWANIFFVNVPPVFGTLFRIFKPILRDNLLQKIQIASKDSTGELLRQYIDDDVLPAFLGGERVDSQGDIYCKEFINQAGKVPEKYFLRNSMHFIDETDPGVKVVTIRARSAFNVPLITKDTGVTFRLEMRTENGGITFSVLYREFGPDPDNPDLPASDEYLDPHNGNSNVILIATKLRAHSDISPADGIGFTKYPGIYILQFDNTDSWFTSRKLFYRTTVYSPDDNEKFNRNWKFPAVTT